MTTPRTFDAVDTILADYRISLGMDFDGYRNHVQRVLNFHVGFSAQAAPEPAVLIAAAFHDLAIWTDDTFDYVVPSVRLASRHLAGTGLARLEPAVRALIVEHHKIGVYRGPHAELVEDFRRADWVDVSLGLRRFGLPRPFIRAVRAAFPDAGFHLRLVELTLRQIGRTPTSPLPMLHL